MGSDQTVNLDELFTIGPAQLLREMTVDLATQRSQVHRWDWRGRQEDRGHAAGELEGVESEDGVWGEANAVRSEQGMGASRAVVDMWQEPLRAYLFDLMI